MGVGEGVEGREGGGVAGGEVGRSSITGNYASLAIHY